MDTPLFDPRPGEPGPEYYQDPGQRLVAELIQRVKALEDKLDRVLEQQTKQEDDGK